jgi:hypothetical protein
MCVFFDGAFSIDILELGQRWVSPKKFQLRPVKKPTLSKLIKDIRLLTSNLMGWVLGQFFSEQVRHKNLAPQTCQEANPIQIYKGHKAPDIYLNGVGVGPVFLEQVSPKNVSPQTCQEANPIKTYKGHKAPDIYLNGVGAGPVFFRTGQAQKCFDPDLSGSQPYPNL